MRRGLACIIALAWQAGWAPAGPGPKDAAKPDPDLVGHWVLVRSFSGDAETTEDPPRTEYEFRADGTWTFRRDGTEDPAAPGTFATDPAARPARIDLTYRDILEPKSRWVVGGIYKVEGESLTL